MQENGRLKTGIEIFISYAHTTKDTPFLEELHTHLEQLKVFIDTWHDRDIAAGAEREREVSTHLERASIILLLVSPDFMASKYHNNVEIGRAMQRHQSGDTTVIPILIRPAITHYAPFSDLQFLPRSARAVADYEGQQDNAFHEITREIEKVIEKYMLKRQARQIALFGYEISGGNRSALWQGSARFSLEEHCRGDHSYIGWLRRKRMFTREEIIDTTWVKAGDHGYFFTLQFQADGRLLEAPLLDNGRHLQGSWNLLEDGVLRTNIEHEEGGKLARYELDIYASKQGLTQAGIEFRDDVETPNAYFVFLPLQPADDSQNKALLACDLLLELSPNSAAIYKTKGKLYQALGDYIKALEAYEQFFEMDDASHIEARDYEDIGWVFYKRGMYAEALGAYERHIQYGSAGEKQYNMKALILRQLGPIDEALEAHEIAVRLASRSGYPDYYMLQQGITLRDYKRLDEAIDVFTQVIAHAPEYAHVYNERGMAYREKGEYEKALADFDQAIAFNRTYSYVYKEKGITLHQLGNYEEALAQLNCAIEKNASDADAHARKGETLFCLQRHNEALIAYQQALSLGYQPRLWGPIREKWESMGNGQEALGSIVSDVIDLSAQSGQQCYFQYGCISWHPERGKNTLSGAIYEKWANLGWEQSLLRYPVTSTTVLPDGKGQYCHFEYDKGCIYWHPDTGAFEVHGAIREKWAELGWEQSVLGYPVTDEYADGEGRVNRFQRGAIYWTPQTGAHEIHGGIWDRWRELEESLSVLGYPTTDEMGAIDGEGRYSHFQHGSIYCHPDTKACEVRGAIRERWAELGWEQSFLGYPVTGEMNAPGESEERRCINYFQHGAICWSEQSGSIVLKGEGRELLRRFASQQELARVLEQAKLPTSTALSLVVYHIEQLKGKTCGHYRVGKNLDANGVVAGGWSEHVPVAFKYKKDREGSGIALIDLEENGIPDLLVFRIDHSDDKNRAYYRVGRYLQADGTVRDGWSETLRIPDPFGKRTLGASIAVADLNQNGRPDLLVFYVTRSDAEQKAFYRIGWNLDGHGLVTGGWSEPISVSRAFGNRQNCIGAALTDLDGNGQPSLLLLFMERREKKIISSWPRLGEGICGFYRVGKRLDRNGLVTGGWGDPIRIPGTFGPDNNGASIAIADLSRNGRPDLVVFSIEHSDGEDRGHYRIGRNLDANGYATGGWSESMRVPGWFGTQNQGAGIAITNLL